MSRATVREPAVATLLWLIFLLFTLFVVFPLARVLGASVFRDGVFTLDVFRDMLTTRGALEPLRNSLVLAAVVAVTGTLTGYATAYALVMVTVPGRRVWRFVSLLPMLAPPFMIALAAIMLFGRNGVLTRAVIEPVFGPDRIDIYGFGGLVLVQTLTFFPLSVLLLAGTFATLDQSLEDAALSAGATPWRVFTTIVLPLTRPAILSSLLLLFIESLADFGNPLILAGDYRVLSVAAFLRITGEFDIAGGAVLAILLLVPALIAFLVQQHYAERSAHATLSGKPSAARRAPRSRLLRATSLCFCMFLAASVCVVYSAVVYGSVVDGWGVSGRATLSNYVDVIQQSGDALRDSLLLAAAATPVAGALGMATAWLLARRKFRGRRLLATLAMLMLAVPGTVMGIGYIVAFNGPPLFLTGTAAIIILLFIFRSVPVSVEAGRGAIRQVDASIEESSASLGATPWTTWRRVVLPLAAPAVFTGLAHAFVRSITAISAVIFVVSGRWNLVTVSILGFVENSDLSRAAALCMVVVAIVSAVLGLMHVTVSRMSVRA